MTRQGTIGLILFGTGLLFVYLVVVSFGAVKPLIDAASVYFEPAAKPAPTSSSGQAPLSGFPQQLSGKLISLEGGQPHDVDTKTLTGVKYWAFYYSASWCPPCRAFTPQLVDFYRDFKPSHPNFELVLVNDDQSEDDMFKYMRDDVMIWPAVEFSEISNSGLKKFAGSGIPDLVLVDADGNVLSDSFGGWGNYLGPQHVVDDIRSMVH